MVTAIKEEKSHEEAGKKQLFQKLALDYVGFNAVQMLFWSAVLNGVLAPPLIVLVVLLTSNPAIMGTRASAPLLRALGWATAAIMTAADIGMFVTL